MTYTATDTTSAGLSGLPRRAEAWLDSKGRAAWIAAMVLGFIFFWPVGLALVAYITWTNRWSKDMFKFNGCSARRNHSHRTATASTGNSAFDAYRTETIRRLEEEQDAFEAFLKRLRDAKDKQEFDAFMEDRARANGAPEDADNRKDVAAY
ncbi:MAG: DUF2852 domain-containing protein [Pseudorhodobacter sp.]